MMRLRCCGKGGGVSSVDAVASSWSTALASSASPLTSSSSTSWPAAMLTFSRDARVDDDDDDDEEDEDDDDDAAAGASSAAGVAVAVRARLVNSVLEKVRWRVSERACLSRRVTAVCARSSSSKLRSAAAGGAAV